MTDRFSLQTRRNQTHDNRFSKFHRGPLRFCLCVKDKHWDRAGPDSQWPKAPWGSIDQQALSSNGAWGLGFDGVQGPGLKWTKGPELQWTRGLSSDGRSGPESQWTRSWLIFVLSPSPCQWRALVRTQNQPRMVFDFRATPEMHSGISFASTLLIIGFLNWNNDMRQGW